MKPWCCFVIFGLFCVTIGAANEPTPCTTPNGEKANCTSLFSCSVLKNAIVQADPTVEKFFEASTLACGNGGLTVCCGTLGNFTASKNVTQEKEEPPKETKKEYALRKLLPSTTFCGMQHTDDYFYNETKTSVDELPWLLQIYDKYPTKLTTRRRYEQKMLKREVRYFTHVQQEKLKVIHRSSFGGAGLRGVSSSNSSVIVYKCAGVLISSRYALTSSTCAAPNKSVAIGEYDSKKSVQCDKTPYGDYCTDPKIKVDIAEQIHFPKGNFVLLRLEESVQYTDFVRPVCLPMNETIRPKVNDSVITSGWGQHWLGPRTYAKKRVKQTITNNEACKKDSSSLNDFCVTLQNQSEYICTSDRGGPLLYRHMTRNWYLEGIIDANKCVNDIIHIWRITSEVVDWILENMKD